MVYLATETFAQKSAMSGESDEQTASIPGLVAAATWAVGLLVGLVALATGHGLVAGVALLVAIAAPWFGLAVVSRHPAHSHHRAARADQVAPYAGGWPALPIASR